jgi:hypothetical protein
MAGDPEWQVRDAAGDALAQIKSPAAYAALVDADAGRDVPAVLWPAALAVHHVSRFAKRLTTRFTHAA